LGCSFFAPPRGKPIGGRSAGRPWHRRVVSLRSASVVPPLQSVRQRGKPFEARLRELWAPQHSRPWVSYFAYTSWCRSINDSLSTLENTFRHLLTCGPM
jgi:hypothetical protein